MRTSDAINEIATALAKAQGAFAAPLKDRQGQARGGKYNYADLASVIEAVRAPLAGNGLAIVQTPTVSDGNFTLISRLIHGSGQWIEATYPLPSAGTAQEIGSAITYARRYTLTAMLGVAPDDDDDGAHAPATTVKPAPQPAVATREPIPMPQSAQAPSRAPGASVDEKQALNARLKAAVERLGKSQAEKAAIRKQVLDTPTLENMREVVEALEAEVAALVAAVQGQPARSPQIPDEEAPF